MSDEPATRAVAEGHDWMRVGTIAAPVGIRGEVKVNLDTDFPDRFKRLKVIYAGEEHRLLHVAAARRHANRVALRFAEVPDRTAAESLRGMPLYIPRAEAMPLPEGHFYHDQIIGLRVVSTAGDALGVIEEVMPTGNNDVYVARGGAQEVLIPAIRDVVRDIDLDAGTMTVELLDGLL